MRLLIILMHTFWPMLPSMLLKKIENRKYPRGMSPWYDLIDWLGGYPFETSSPEEIFSFYNEMNYYLVSLMTVGSKMGCNEFVFKKK